jgi:hypothetical protein
MFLFLLILQIDAPNTIMVIAIEKGDRLVALLASK